MASDRSSDELKIKQIHIQMIEKATGGPQPLAQIAEAHAHEVTKTCTAGLPSSQSDALSLW